MDARPSLFAIALVLALPIDAAAGPYASEAMGNINYGFPSSFHVGGGFNAVVARGRDGAIPMFNGEGFLEYHALDIMAVGLVMRSQALRELPDGLGKRANTVRGRLRFRMPLVRGARLRGTVVPLLSLAFDFGGGWLGDASDKQALFAFGTQLRFELLLAGRVSPYVSVGYDRTRVPGGNVRQLDVGLGLTLRLAGRSAFGPRPQRTRPEEDVEQRGLRQRAVDALIDELDEDEPGE